MWLNVPFKTTKEAICAIMGLNSTSRLPVLKSMKNEKVTEATGAQWDIREMTI